MARFDPDRSLRPALQSYRGYVPIESPDEIAARYGVSLEGIVKLDGNENPFGPSPRALAALARDYAAHRYPDPDHRGLRAALSDRLVVAPACIVAGAGSDELIDLLFRCCVDADDRILIASPTFGMYAFNAELNGAQVVDIPLLDGWQLDMEPLVEAARDAKIVFLASPNNPTANAFSREDIERLLDTGALVVIDEAYIEFSHEDSLAPLGALGAPLVVLRTFSKWGGLAGLRIGYGVMPEALAGALMSVKQPYNVSVPAELAAIASLEDAALLDDRACTITGERERMADALRGTGWVEPDPSETNFLLCRLKRLDGATVQEGLRRRGVLVRYFDEPRLRQYIRISAGTAEDTDRVLTALDEIADEITP
ncbi:MAG TPA: histidinol-phosphate transaminase [Dehalococcoidia bacterium]|nr:histidinol-phosphate transaminase [Dehalococcoidia bacterium]